MIINSLDHNDHSWNMQTALELAEQAYRMDEVPVGAIILDGDGKVIASAHNLKEATQDPCGHAEILAIRKAAESLNSWRLLNCSMYVTLEPCVMCIGALLHARIKSLYFGAYDKKGGAISTGHRVFDHPLLNHKFSVIGGIKHYECSKVLSRFFREKRERYKSSKSK